MFFCVTKFFHKTCLLIILAQTSTISHIHTQTDTHTHMHACMHTIMQGQPATLTCTHTRGHTQIYRSLATIKSLTFILPDIIQNLTLLLPLVVVQLFIPVGVKLLKSILGLFLSSHAKYQYNLSLCLLTNRCQCLSIFLNTFSIAESRQTHQKSIGHQKLVQELEKYLNLIP